MKIKYQLLFQYVSTEDTPVPTDVTRSKSSLSSQFKATKGQWECDGCLIRNEPTSNLCVACETPKPGYTPVEKPKEGLY